MTKRLIENSKNYFVNTKGEVFNSKHLRLRTRIRPDGYEQIGIWMEDTNKRKWFPVHRLVAVAFIPNPDNKPFVNHIDGNKSNNNVSNLEWVTPKENMFHSVNVLRKGLGEGNGNSVITEEIAETICKLLEKGFTNWEISSTVNVTLGIISNIRNGTTWKEISSKYKIPKKSRVVSDSTVRWICEQIQEGLTTRQILDLSTNPRITKCMVNDIRRRGLYSDISRDYAF